MYAPALGYARLLKLQPNGAKTQNRNPVVGLQAFVFGISRLFLNSLPVSYHRPYRTPFPVHLLPPLHTTQPHKSYNVLRRQDKPPTMRYRLPLLLLLPTSHDMHGPQRPERSVSHMLPSRFGLCFHPDHHMRHKSNERNAAPGKPDACVRDGGREFAHLWR
jgi:hypothetical protein